MNISIIGTGYVGLVTGTCFAGLGHLVICADTDKKKISLLKKSVCPIHEPFLPEMIRENVKSGRLSFTTNILAAISSGDIVFNCTGTPLTPAGSPDLSATIETAKLFALSLAKRNGGREIPFKIFVNKSTVPVGTGSDCFNIIQDACSGEKFFQSKRPARPNTKPPSRSHKHNSFAVVSNPEFLRQGSAVRDFLKPDRIIIGTDNARAAAVMKQLYQTFTKSRRPVILTDINTAELVKYTANAFLATKISFINEIAAYCEKTNINIKDISKAVGLDSRIGAGHLQAGIGFGGGCLSKDIKSLIQIGRKSQSRFRILEQVSFINSRQRVNFAKKILSELAKTYGKKPVKIAVWGLTFKPQTDDLRDSPALEIVAQLQKAGHILRLYDPAAAPKIRKLFARAKNTGFYPTKEKAANGAAALVILTGWEEFRAAASSAYLHKLKSLMKGSIIFDGRNIIKRSIAESTGFTYRGIGQ